MIKFWVSSHINFFPKTYPILTPSLINSGIPPEDIYFFIGGEKTYNNIKDENGVNIFKVPHNSIDFTSLISVLELDIYSPYWFLLHDTTYVGPNFYKKITEYNYINKSAVSLSYDLSMNIGAYSWELIKNNSEKILNFKNTDYSDSSIQYFKQLGIPNEDWLFINNKHNHYCSNPREIIESNNVYNTGVNRIIEVFKEIELYKIKANWNNKPTYELNL